MANLIPPDAKRAITTEYWIRVVVLWCVICVIALIVIGLLKFPTLLLIRNNMGGSADAFSTAEEKQEAFLAAQKTINETNEVAVLLADLESARPYSRITETLDQIAGSAVVIDTFVYAKGDEEKDVITITGTAATRNALADFSNDIEEHPWFSEAALPISNLAKDSNIAFNISITPTSE